MASDPESRPKRPIALWLLGTVVGLAAVGLVAVAWQSWQAGDSLITAKEQAEAEAKKKEAEAKQKDKDQDPQVERLVVQPGEPKSDAQSLKPGHWATGTERMRATYEDFAMRTGDSQRTSSTSSNQDGC